ncbi:ACT domain-containing protein [Nocardioides alpinus]|uniref:ACT domain-containing protein n=1 Tax=Nocardioides alpinus TaxID=748909 RepID=A0A1I1B3L6_9ACTN|nr:ACT domain-containing protein [Nocardioides alpinus]PKH40189.1 ACT domain-containing protein [Nocardioides alpinus]SFB44841.1 ACT domain-containing protein [Nocardioides alpinus]
MPYLMRVELPDVPGSLGRVASAIGEAGGDIEAIEIVEKRDGFAVDDVLLEIPSGTMPDSIISACSTLDGVSVLWISRYAAGGNLFLDLEVVESLTEDPTTARDRLVDLLPIAFRVDWAARIRRGADGLVVVHATDAAPTSFELGEITGPTRLPGDETYVELAAPFGDDLMLLGRRGGPEFLDSELARLEHLLGLAVTISSH